MCVVLDHCNMVPLGDSLDRLHLAADTSIMDGHDRFRGRRYVPLQPGFVEIQGTGEQKTFSKADFDHMTESALAAAQEIRATQLTVLKSAGFQF